MTGRRLLVLGAVLVVAAIVAGGLLLIRPGDDSKSLTVYFPRTVSLYEGADVRILGVPVGQVDSVTPMGERVKVELSWDSEYQVPADAKAVIVSPAIVGDRFIQLTPAYESGPEMEDGAVLDASDSAVPVELDQVYESLDQLATALGPEGVNEDGSLDRLLSKSAQAFDGQGKKFHRMLKDLSKLTDMLEGNKDELFGSMTQLERFVKALADNDAAVREFNASLSEVSRMLEGERRDLAGALRALSGSLDEIRTYVRDNRGTLRRNVDALVDVTNQLVDQRRNLAKILDTAPTTLANQVLAYDPSIGALDNRTTVLPFSKSMGFRPFENSLDSTLVTPSNTSTWSGAIYSMCAFLSHHGAPAVQRCDNVFTPDFFEALALRGLKKPAPVAAIDQMQDLRRNQVGSGLGRLWAVRSR